MHTFRVWAPSRSRVDLVVAGSRQPMHHEGAGWWSFDDPASGPGTRYGFSLDAGEVRPDPRSMSQPDGVAELSEVVDHDSHRWNDAAWRGRPLEGSVIYELHTGTFSIAGTFDGAIEHLPHLVELGVNTVEVMPVAEFPGERGWGYDGVDLFAPHHVYGGPAGLKRLVDACHQTGLAAVLDVVYNHLGPAGNFLPEFGPYFNDHHQTRWGSALNFDAPGNEEVRRFVIDNALMWIRDYHFDGLRLDAAQAIVDRSAAHVLEELAVEVRSLGARLGREVFVIAETDTNDARFVKSPRVGGYGMDAVSSDDWHHSLHAVLTGEQAGYYRHFGSLQLLGDALVGGWLFEGSRAERRRVSKQFKRGVATHQLVVGAQNHDQVGNRMAGERLTALVDEGRLKIAAALLLMTTCTPMLFQGEEWAASSPFQYFTDHADPALGRAVAAGRRRELAAFGWSRPEVPDPQDRATFERSKLDWCELAEPLHRRMLSWYRDLLSLRRRLGPGAAAPSVEVDEGAGTILYHRGGVTVAANLGDADWVMRMPNGSRLALASDAVVTTAGAGVCLPRASVAILETSAE